MKLATNIAGGLLGFLFLLPVAIMTFHLVQMPVPVEGTPEAHFMAAFIPTGYMSMVKLFEFLGAVLVAIPLTRNFGLLVLGPIIINILAFHTFVKNGDGLANPMIILIVILALFLLWAARHQFAALKN